MGTRLAKLIPNAAGIFERTQTTYTYLGTLLPWRLGRPDPHQLYGNERPRLAPWAEYESVCIRLTGGFDD